MSSGFPYPIFLSLTNRHVLIIGLGEVGCRKLQALLYAGANSILALDLLPENELSVKARQLLANDSVQYEQRPLNPSDLDNCFLVFACTNDSEENSSIAKFCAIRNVLCNSATDPEQGSFIAPAVARQGALCAAFSTGAQSPALARKWRKDLQAWLEPREKLTWLLGKLRPLILGASPDSRQNAAYFRNIAESPIQEWLAAGEIDKCLQWLKTNLKFIPASDLEEIVEQYAANFS